MPQTIEHVEILDLLGITRGVVAVTKCDLVEPDLVELVTAEVQELLADTGLKHAPIVPVSGVTGAGLDELRIHLRAAAAHADRRRRGPFRMPVDRVFNVAGRGVVVTGSVIAGDASRGDAVDIWPAGDAARIREVQTHGQSADDVHAGQRAAVNLQGIDKQAIDRGCELAAAGVFAPTRLIDAHLHCLRSHRQAIKNHARLRLCIGTREVLARCVTLETDGLALGESGLVQLRCYEPVVGAYGQRFIVRDENAARTAGGGVVLRAAQRRISSRMTAEVAGLHTTHTGGDRARLAEVIRYHGLDTPAGPRLALAAGVDVEDLPELLDGLRQDGALVELPGVDQPLSAEFIRAFQARALRWLERYHALHPDEPGCLAESFTGWLERKTSRTVARAVTQRLLDADEIKNLGRYVCLKAFAPNLSAQDERVMQQILDACHAGAFQPPAMDHLLRTTGASRARVDKLLKVAVSTGQLVRVDAAILLHADREAEMRRRLTDLYAAEGPFTLSRMREVLDTSRKYAVPLAEYLDKIGFTQRSGDQRAVSSEDEC